MKKAVIALKKYREDVKKGIIKPKERSKRPSYAKAVRLKCEDCMSDYVDGRIDCEVVTCSLYYWMPYNKEKTEKRQSLRDKKNDI